MKTIDEIDTYIDTKTLPMEYLILKLRMSFNKDLYEDKVITFDIYNKMQKLLLGKMYKILLDSIKERENL